MFKNYTWISGKNTTFNFPFPNLDVWKISRIAHKRAKCPTHFGQGCSMWPQIQKDSTPKLWIFCKLKVVYPDLNLLECSPPFSAFTQTIFLFANLIFLQYSPERVPTVAGDRKGIMIVSSDCIVTIYTRAPAHQTITLQKEMQWSYLLHSERSSSSHFLHKKNLDMLDCVH